MIWGQSHFHILPICIQIAVVNCEGWAWLGGDKRVDQVSSDWYPGARSGASTWHDVKANLTWMFGGQGFSDVPSGKPSILNDLWLFDSEAKDRTDFFVKIGPNVLKSHGAKKSDSQQKEKHWPAKRHYASMCGLSDMLVLFGGLGEDANALGDTWVYDLKAENWTLLLKSGPSPRGHSGVWCFGSFMYVFGGVGANSQLLNDLWKFNLLSLEWNMLQSPTSGKSFLPRARNGPATWIRDEALYMFGGNTAMSFSYSMQLADGLVSDLWRYFDVNSTWECVSDPLKTIFGGIHAKVKISSNSPSPRIGAGSWEDSSGNLWLFGGAGMKTEAQTENKHSQVLSDLWQFNIKIKTWMFVGGSKKSDQAGFYTALGKETKDGIPSGRTEMMVFPGHHGKAYIFGGVGHDARRIGGFLNDLWSVGFDSALNNKYRISTWSVLLFLGFGISLLVLGLMIGFWGQRFKGLDVESRERQAGAVGHHYKKLMNDLDF